MKSVATTAAVLVLAVVTSLPAFADGGRTRFSGLEPVVFRELDAAGVSRDEVTEIRFDVQRHAGRDSDRVRGILAWVRLASCDEGGLIVDMAPNGRVRQVYTRGGCQVEGVRGTC